MNNIEFAMPFGNITQWITGLLLVVIASVTVVRLYTDGWLTMWEETFLSYFEMLAVFETTVYKYQDDEPCLAEISGEYVDALIKNLGKRRDRKQLDIANIDVTEYLLRLGAGRIK
jgi:hypothetical protein